MENRKLRAEIMSKNILVILLVMILGGGAVLAADDVYQKGFGELAGNAGDYFGTQAAEKNSNSETTVVAEYQQEKSSAYVTGAMYNGQKGVAVIFEGTNDLHYYADKETALGGQELKVIATSDTIQFGEAVYPGAEEFFDASQQKNVDVFVGDFQVFIPVMDEAAEGKVVVQLSGLACTSKFCLKPFVGLKLNEIDLANTTFREITLETASKDDSPAAAATGAKQSYSAPVAFVLAIVAGLILNIMPCVWPVIPIIVMRIWQQAQENKAKSFGLGLSFCGGILLFFAAIAILNIVLRLGFDTVFQWGDQFRNPVFVTVLSLVMVVLAMFMFGLFAIGIPASVSSKASGGSGAMGSVGMGFLAAMLSTPCSFAILAAVFAWAQTQPLPIATITIMLMGVGMAVPYLILTSIPGLLNKMPRPGGWMEKVKIGLGFLLLLIAAKVFKAVPDENKINVLYYAVILSACVWIYGWVNFATAKGRKFLTRLVAVLIAVGAGMVLLPTDKDLVDWQEYDAVVIERSVEEGRPVLIKFTADWCMSCEVLDKFVFKKKVVADLIEKKGILAIKADTTTDELPATRDLANKYNEPGVPVTILYMPDGTVKHLVGVIGKNELIEAISGLPDVEKQF